MGNNVLEHIVAHQEEEHIAIPINEELGNLMVAPHAEHLDEGSGEVSIKGSVLPLVPKEAYLHEEDIPTRATPSIINKG